MINLHEFVTDSRAFRKFQLGELLFVEYHCVFDELRKGFWTPCNCLIYILRGQKKWRSLDREYTGRLIEA